MLGFNMGTFAHYYIAYAPAAKVRALMLQNVGKINGIPPIPGI